MHLATRYQNYDATIYNKKKTLHKIVRSNTENIKKNIKKNH